MHGVAHHLHHLTMVKLILMFLSGERRGIIQHGQLGIYPVLLAQSHVWVLVWYGMVRCRSEECGRVLDSSTVGYLESMSSPGIRVPP